jgi:collagen type VI alpha
LFSVACGFVDLVFVLDSSSSVLSVRFSKMKDFVKHIIEIYDIDGGSTRVGLITYNDDAQIRFNLNSFDKKIAIFEFIDSMGYSGGATNTANALFTARTQMFVPEKGDRSDVDNMIVLLTDGISTEPAVTKVQAGDAHADGIRVLVVGIATTVDTHELMDVASTPVERNIFHIANFDELTELIENVVLCSGTCSSR